MRRAGQLLASGPAVAGAAYKGVRAGSVRFALLRLPKAARTDGLRVRALAADGALISVLATSATKSSSSAVRACCRVGRATFAGPSPPSSARR